MQPYLTGDSYLANTISDVRVSHMVRFLNNSSNLSMTGRVALKVLTTKSYDERS